MGNAATIVFAREDFTIPGASDEAAVGRRGAPAAEARFFDLLRDRCPDVVVLDLSRSNGHGVETILKIRQESTIPILVVCDLNQPASHEYKLAGAAECIPAPVDIVLLNQTLQKIIRVTGPAKPRGNRTPDALVFAGITFRPHENLLVAASGAATRLTTSENRLLLYFASTPWVLRTRGEVGEMLYGRHRPTSDRAIDVVVNRLRKKLTALCGPTGQSLIKTEFRRGYMLVADVAMPSSGGMVDAPERAFAANG